MDYKACVQYLLDIPFFGKKAGLYNISEMLKRLGNPQENLRFIHVAGTNGKGSVCTMLSYIYSKMGYRVGLFTSPHLEKINERLRINNEPIDDTQFVLVTMKVKELIDNMVLEGLNHPTFFETMLAMAILFFEQQKVDMVILETGIGGRLDPTNIIMHPLISIITQIDYDHVDILGDSLEKIAFEKGGIIKEGCKVVLYNDEKELVNSVIRGICTQKSAMLYEVPVKQIKILERTYKSVDFSIDCKYYKYDRLRLNTSAIYQIGNALTALTAVSVLENEIHLDENLIPLALSEFFWPGRMEMINDNILLDGAHNESGIEAFVETICENFKERNITLLFAAMKDKACEQMVSNLRKCSNIEKVIITEVYGKRCMSAQEMKDIFNENGFYHVEIEKDSYLAFTNNKPKTSDELFCCVGSLYLIGEIKTIIRGGKS